MILTQTLFSVITVIFHFFSIRNWFRFEIFSKMIWFVFGNSWNNLDLSNPAKFTKSNALLLTCDINQVFFYITMSISYFQLTSQCTHTLILFSQRSLLLFIVKRRRLFSTERRNVNKQNKVIHQKQQPRHLGVILDSATVILFSNENWIKWEKCKPMPSRSHPRYQQRFSLKFSTTININIHNKPQHHRINDE